MYGLFIQAHIVGLVGVAVVFMATVSSHLRGAEYALLLGSGLMLIGGVIFLIS